MASAPEAAPAVSDVPAAASGAAAPAGAEVEEEDRGGYFEFVNPRATALDGDYGTLGDDDDAAGDGGAVGDGEIAVAASATVVAAVASATAIAEGDSGAAAGAAGEAAGEVEAGEEEFDEEDEPVDGVLAGMSKEQIEEIVAMRLRQLEREYSEMHGGSGGGGAGTGAGAGAASGGSGDGGGDSVAAIDPVALEKARKLQALRARLAEARAMRAATARLVLAEGADEFPDDYDELQRADQEALVAAIAAGKVARGMPSLPPLAPDGSVVRGAGAGAKASGKRGGGPKSKRGGGRGKMAAPIIPADSFDEWVSAPAAGATTPAVSATVTPAPAAAGSGAAAAAAAPAPITPAAEATTPLRPVSPLRDEQRSAITAAMSRIRIVPKGRVPAWTEQVVAAALVKGRQLRAEGAASAPAAASTAAASASADSAAAAPAAATR